MDIIFNRRSIRKYEDKPIEKEKIETLLKAAMQAPSAGNQRPWEFIVVENKDTLKTLSETSLYSKMVETSAVTLVVLSRKEEVRFPECVTQDMSAAVENILLEAVQLGLGAVWLGVAPSEDRMNYIRKIFDLPEDVEPFAMVPVGYPDGQKNEFVDRFEAERVHYESWK